MPGLADAGRTTPAIRTRQTITQVKNLLRRLQLVGGDGARGAPLVISGTG